MDHPDLSEGSPRASPHSFGAPERCFDPPPPAFAAVIAFCPMTLWEEDFMRVFARLSCASVVLLSAAAFAQTVQPGPSIMYKNLDYRFGVIFPGQAQPMARDVTYTTKDGATVPARQFFLERPGAQ